MKNMRLIYFLTAPLIFLASLSLGKTSSGGPLIDSAVNDAFVEYFMKGDSIPETGVSYVAIIDTSNQSILVTARDVSLRDSLFPGNTTVGKQA